MDPNEARERLNQLLTNMDSGTTLDEVSELWQGLDSWLSGGGFLPSAWER